MMRVSYGSRCGSNEATSGRYGRAMGKPLQLMKTLLGSYGKLWGDCQDAMGKRRGRCREMMDCYGDAIRNLRGIMGRLCGSYAGI